MRPVGRWTLGDKEARKWGSWIFPLLPELYSGLIGGLIAWGIFCFNSFVAFLALKFLSNKLEIMYGVYVHVDTICL